MGYYLFQGLVFVSTVVFIYYFAMRKFPKRNLYFAFSFVYIYINFMILGILSYIPAMHQAHNHWTNTALHILGVKLKELSGSERVLKKGKRTLYLFNHRSIFDFNVHDAICEYDANYLSSETVGYYMPFTYLATRWMNSVFFFKRGGRGSNLQPQVSHNVSFFLWLDSQFDSKFTMKNGLIFYGEGHRNPSPDPLPLKKGMIRYSYERKIPIQMIMAFGVENVMLEKELRVNYGKTVRYFRYPLLKPQDFISEEEYFSHIQSLFVKRFYEIKRVCEKEEGN